MMHQILILVAALQITPSAQIGPSEGSLSRVLKLAGTAGNPRNSEGAFITLRNGDILFVYSKFTGGAGDGDKAHVASRLSRDHGRTWTTQDRVVVPPDDHVDNTMSVSLLRVRDERIALIYLLKRAADDCRPMICFSKDEGATWTSARPIIPDSQIGYYVVNNDRVVQLKSGRLVVPAARHARKGEKFDPSGHILCYLSADAGATWRAGESVLHSAVVLQEPGIVELKDGRLLMFCRTKAGSQYLSESKDGGSTWTEPRASSIVSPRSPASMKRIPGTGDLLLIWNRNYDPKEGSSGFRTPLNTAISRDEGRTWAYERVLENDPNGWFCYTAIHFIDDQVLLAYCAGDRRKTNGLAETQIVRLPVSWFYGAAASSATAP